VISHPDAEAIFASLQTPETERGMRTVPLPQRMVLRGETLNFRWQRLEKLPESPGGGGFHSGDGHSRRRPFADSLSASSKRKLSLPAEASASICSSHRPCSRRRNHCTMRRNSSGGRPSIAASISSIRLMLEVYHHPAVTLPGSGHDTTSLYPPHAPAISTIPPKPRCRRRRLRRKTAY
jgi:hypothetical protein